MSRKTKKDYGSPVPLRVPGDMQKRIQSVAEKSGNNLSEAAVMRMAIERGIAAVERMFDPPQKKAA